MCCYILIISVLLMTAINVRAQCERPVVGENRILSNVTEEQLFASGSILKFKCASGYVPVRISVGTISCTGTQWSDLELKCKKKSCGSPGEILNGMYQFPDGISFGATITAVCNEGYMLVGPSTRNCRENGWDVRAPVCEVVKCKPPPSIPNGIFEPKEDLYNYQEAVTYSCDGGLNLIGSSVITCSIDGTFQPKPPRCLYVSCDRPEISNAVRVEGKSPPYYLNHFVRYACMRGYRMQGSESMTCTEDGWTPPPPNCTEITCDSPQITNVDNSQLSPSYNYGSSVQIRCKESYRVDGSNTVTCGDHGWNPSLPQCIKITCDSPQITNADNSQLSPSYSYGSQVNIKCKDGYKIKGSNYVTCGEHGWNLTFTQCIEVTCDMPHFKHGLIIEKKIKFGYKSSIQVQCIDGYKMDGPEYLTCEETGWNPPPPQCRSSTSEVWHIVIPVLILTLLVLAVITLLVFYYKKKSKENKNRLKPENCTLVDLLPATTSDTSETPPKTTY